MFERTVEEIEAENYDMTDKIYRFNVELESAKVAIEKAKRIIEWKTTQIKEYTRFIEINNDEIKKRN